MTFRGSPALENISDMCSTMVGVCGEGLRMTELPANNAGIKELTRIRYGYYADGISLARETGLKRGAAHVPCEKDEDRSNRELSNVPFEAMLQLARCVFESLVTDLEKILAPSHSSGDLFGPISYWSSHLLRQLTCQNILLVVQQLQCFPNDILALLEWSMAIAVESLGGFGR